VSHFANYRSFVASPRPMWTRLLFFEGAGGLQHIDCSLPSHSQYFEHMFWTTAFVSVLPMQCYVIFLQLIFDALQLCCKCLLVRVVVCLSVRHECIVTKRWEISQGCYWSLIRNRIHPFSSNQNHRSWMTLKVSTVTGTVQAVTRFL